MGRRTSHDPGAGSGRPRSLITKKSPDGARTYRSLRSAYPDGLTKREVEVLRLLTHSMTDISRGHGPNEHIRLEDFLLNINLITVLLAEFSAQDANSTR